MYGTVLKNQYLVFLSLNSIYIKEFEMNIEHIFSSNHIKV